MESTVAAHGTTRDDAAPGVRETAPAKLNLALHVVGRRADGYHLLDSLVVFCDPPAADVVHLARAGSPGAGGAALAVDGPFAGALAGEAAADNLAVRALAALEAARSDGAASAPPASFRIRLAKNLPVAAGIGGGSADAAAVVRAWARLTGEALPPERRAAIALSLGADVPVCLAGRPAIMRGIGEALTTLPAGALPALPVVLARPPVAVSTGAVFSRLASRENPPMPPLPDRLDTPATVARWLGEARNDLEPAARAVAPAIDDCLAALAAAEGALLARLSGSGATCFALFADTASAAAAADRLAAARPDWWVVATRTGPA